MTNAFTHRGEGWKAITESVAQGEVGADGKILSDAELRTLLADKNHK